MRRILGCLTCGWCCCAKINGKRVPAWQLDQHPLGTDQFTSVDSEVDEMQRRNNKRVVHVTLSTTDDRAPGEADDPDYGPFGYAGGGVPIDRAFRILIQLQIISRDNYLRNDLMTPMVRTAIEMVMGHILIEGPFVHDSANGTVSFLAQCSHQNIAAMWCDPLQWPAVTAALTGRLLRLAFARRVGPKVATVGEALSGGGEAPAS